MQLLHRIQRQSGIPVYDTAKSPLYGAVVRRKYGIQDTGILGGSVINSPRNPISPRDGMWNSRRTDPSLAVLIPCKFTFTLAQFLDNSTGRILPEHLHKRFPLAQVSYHVRPCDTELPVYLLRIHNLHGACSQSVRTE